MVDVFVYLTGIDPAKPVNTITVEERAAIVRLLKCLRVTVVAMGPLEEAIVTAGGVPIGEIDPRTMMSKLVSGLYFAGEIIDIDAETGGFNLQAAFSTGYVAGESAARSAVGYRLIGRSGHRRLPRAEYGYCLLVELPVSGPGFALGEGPRLHDSAPAAA